MTHDMPRPMCGGRIIHDPGPGWVPGVFDCANLCRTRNPAAWRDARDNQISQEISTYLDEHWTLALLGMALGVLGLFNQLGAAFGRVTRPALLVAAVGLGLMTLSSFVEYWVLFGLPHKGA